MLTWAVYLQLKAQINQQQQEQKNEMMPQMTRVLDQIGGNQFGVHNEVLAVRGR